MVHIEVEEEGGAGDSDTKDGTALQQDALHSWNAALALWLERVHVILQSGNGRVSSHHSALALLALFRSHVIHSSSNAIDSPYIFVALMSLSLETSSPQNVSSA